MVIYKTTNLINGKIYIGRDIKNNPKYLGSGKILKESIKKYGINNFKKEIIEIGKSIDDLNKKEEKWILYFNSTNPKIGYNITKGGSGGRTYNKKIYQYSLDGKYIKEWDSIHDCSKSMCLDNSCLGKAAKGIIKKHGNYMWSAIKLRKMKPYYDNKSKPIIQKTLGGKFLKCWKSLNDVKKTMKYDGGNIIASIKRKGTAYGYKWENNLKIKQ